MNDPTTQYAITRYSVGHRIFDARDPDWNKTEARTFAVKGRIPKFHGITTTGRVIEFTTAIPAIGIPVNPPIKKAA